MIRHLIARYLKHLTRTGYALRSQRTYASELEYFAAFLDEQGIDEPLDLTRDRMAEFQVSLFTAKTPKGAPLHLRTQSCKLQVVRGFVRYLVAQGVLLVNPTEGMELPRLGPRPPPRNVPSEEEVLRLLAAPDLTTLRGIRDAAMLELFYSTGLRATELIRLKVYDVNLPTRRLQVRGGKGGRDRVVPVGRLAAAAVGRYLDRTRPSIAAKDTTGLLFLSMHGRPLDRSRVVQLVVAYCRKAGLERHYTTHSLRHACATHMLRGRASIRHIQELLGHRFLSTTQIYTQVEIDDLKAVHARTHPRERDPKDS